MGGSSRGAREDGGPDAGRSALEPEVAGLSAEEFRRELEAAEGDPERKLELLRKLVLGTIRELTRRPDES